LSEENVEYEPPRCPNCGSNLFFVDVDTYRSYIYDPKKGTYGDETEKTEIMCPDCSADLSDLFPKGVCNYSTKAIIEEIEQQERELKEASEGV